MQTGYLITMLHSLIARVLCAVLTVQWYFDATRYMTHQERYSPEFMLEFGPRGLIFTAGLWLATTKWAAKQRFFVSMLLIPTFASTLFADAISTSYGLFVLSVTLWSYVFLLTKRHLALKNPIVLNRKAEAESYVYFDRNIRPLPKKPDGSIDTMQSGFQNNDVDAFRHAYVSGVMTHEFGEKLADLLGRLHEFRFSNAPSPDRNMDLWNNEFGIKLAKKHRSKRALARAIKLELENGRLIVDPKDERRFQGTMDFGLESRVVVLEKSARGVNQVFFDRDNSRVMTRGEFVRGIKRNQFPGYSLRNAGGTLFPVSNPNGVVSDNLG